MFVRYILSNACLRLGHFSQLSFMQYMGAVCIQLTHLYYDDCKNTCTLSCYHHQIKSMTHLPLFRFGHGPLARYVKLRVAHAPGMSRTFFTLPTSKETASKRSRHASRHVRDARAVMHVGIANPRWRGKRSRHSRRMHNPQFYVSGKRPMTQRYALYVFLHSYAYSQPTPCLQVPWQSKEPVNKHL